MSFLRKTLAAAALGGLIIGGVVGGQVLNAQPKDADSKKADVAVPMGNIADLSPREMTTKADEYIFEMKRTLRRVLTLQKAARKQKDIIKLNCVNDKLLQVKQLLNIAEASRNNLVEAISNSDAGARAHQFSQVTVAADSARGMRDEAEACIGEELTFVGPTEVEVIKPPIVDDPTRADPFDFDSTNIERPAFASPYN